MVKWYQWGTYINSVLNKAQGIPWKRRQQHTREDRDECCEMLPSGHEIAVTVMNLQLLQLTAQDQE